MAASAPNPAVAVVVPLFNRLEPLRTTMASVPAQTLAGAGFLWSMTAPTSQRRLI